MTKLIYDENGYVLLFAYDNLKTKQNRKKDLCEVYC